MLSLRGRIASPFGARARLLAAVPSRAFAADKPTHPEGLTTCISSYLMPQENTWQDQGTHLVKKKLDLYDHLAMAVGPRPDTVTSDNLRSSRSETEFRPYNPGTPVDLATDTPITPIIPQSTGSNVAPTETYDNVFDIKYFTRDTRVLTTLALSERQALLESGESSDGTKAPSATKSALPPRPPSFGLKNPNGRTATNGPVDGS